MNTLYQILVLGVTIRIAVSEKSVSYYDFDALRMDTSEVVDFNITFLREEYLLKDSTAVLVTPTTVHIAKKGQHYEGVIRAKHNFE